MKLKRLFLVFCVSLLTLYSCEENNKITSVCTIEDPLQNLEFLKEAKDTIDKVACAGKSTITQYTYNSNTVFEVNICDQIADGQTLIYDCSGEIICTFGGIAGENTCPDFYDTATNKIILYGN